MKAVFYTRHSPIHQFANVFMTLAKQLRCDSTRYM